MVGRVISITSPCHLMVRVGSLTIFCYNVGLINKFVKVFTPLVGSGNSWRTVVCIRIYISDCLY